MENICANKVCAKRPLNTADSPREKHKKATNNGCFRIHFSKIHLQRRPIYKFCCHFFADLRHNDDFIQMQ